MIRTYKYKLYNRKRLKYLNQRVDIAGIIYNHCIALYKRYYKLFGKSSNKFQLQKHLTKLKKLSKYSFWKMVPSQAIQEITDRIDKAYKLFFRNQKQGVKSSPPSFKKVKRYKSITLKQAGYKIDGNVISLGGYKFKFWLSRPIIGKIKTITIKRDNIGDFYICIVLEQEETKENITSGKIVGIDFLKESDGFATASLHKGLKTFLTLSDDTKVKSPRYYLKHLNQLKKLQKRLSKKIKDSNNYKKAKRRLSKLHQKVINSRRDFFHKLANSLAKKYEYIVIEDLNMKAMQKLWGRKISDLAFSEFVSILEYKANLIKIDRFYPSSKTCSNCGFVLDKLNLKDRSWICPECTTYHDRDLNASINICRVGASTLGIGEVRPAIVSFSA